jgi:hypothetical protein
MTFHVNFPPRLFTESLFSFVTDVHDRLTRRGNEKTLQLGEGALAFLREVLEDTDRFFKREDPFAYTYLHHTLPLGGFSHETLAKLKLEGASGGKILDEMFRISSERTFHYAAELIRQTGGELTHRQQGEILFFLGRLLHCTQDRKHREENRNTTTGEPFEWPAHIPPLGSERHHCETDEAPPPGMEQRAGDRTVDLLKGFLSSLDREVPSRNHLKEAIHRLRNFQKASGESVDDFEPRNSSFIFPPYEAKIPSYFKTPFSAELAYDTSTLRPSLGLNLRTSLLKAARFKANLEFSLKGGYSFDDSVFLKGGLGPALRPFDLMLIEPRTGIEFTYRDQFGERIARGAQASAYVGLRTNFPFLFFAENAAMLGLNLYFPLWESKGYPRSTLHDNSGSPYFLASLNLAVP